MLFRGGLTERAQGAPGAGSRALPWGRTGWGASGELGGSPALLLLLVGQGHATQGGGPPQGAPSERILKGTRTEAVRIPSREVGIFPIFPRNFTILSLFDTYWYKIILLVSACFHFIPLQAFAHDVPSPRRVCPHPQAFLKSWLLFKETLQGYQFCNACTVPHLHEPQKHASAFLPLPLREAGPSSR